MFALNDQNLIKSYDDQDGFIVACMKVGWKRDTMRFVGFHGCGLQMFGVRIRTRISEKMIRSTTVFVHVIIDVHRSPVVLQSIIEISTWIHQT